MVFISLTKPLEEFLKENKETRFNNLDWFLFDRLIENKKLDIQYGWFDHKQDLNAYMSRIFYYPIYYKEPLYCYLMTNNYFSKLDFFPKEKENTAAIWCMKKVPDNLKEEQENKDKYVRVKKEEVLFGGHIYKDTHSYIRKKFEELVSVNLRETGISCVILDGK